MVLEQKLGLELCSPADDLLARLNLEHLGRRVVASTMAALSTDDFPAFVKSLVPKQIRSRVYGSAAELEAEAAGLAGDTGVLLSSPVDIVAEARTFVLDQRVLDCAVYEGAADLTSARAFAGNVAADALLPRVSVLDVGLLRDGRWIVIELNAAWGAGLNGCSAERVLPAIAAASRARGSAQTSAS